MSDISLYSGLYEQIREYAELVDDVILSLREGTSLPNDASRQKLGKLLMNLASDRWDNLSTYLIASMLREKGGVAKAKWSKVGNALLSNEVDDTVVELLERLACSLEQEQARAIARMRGLAR